MAEVTPGTLCLVVSGRNTGRCVETVRPVSATDVQLELMNIFRIAVKPPDGVIWMVNEPMLWGPRGRPAEVWGEAPFITQSRLLPIPPLADPLSVKHEEEIPA